MFKGRMADKMYFHADTQMPNARVTKERMFSKESMREKVLGIKKEVTGQYSAEQRSYFLSF